MANYREIVTKTVLGKGKKLFTNHYSLTPEEAPTTILGCWVINHKFEGFKENDKKTLVSKQTIAYDEVLNVAKKRESDISNATEIIVRSLSGPTCTKVEIQNGIIEYDIEKELGIEIVGDAKVKIAVDETEDDWDEILDETEENNVMDEIDQTVKEDFINEKK